MSIGALEIREKTDELAELIRRHPLTIEHARLRAEVGTEARSRELLERLIRLGAMIDQTARRGKTAEIPESERAELVRLLEADSIVKTYVGVRRELVAMIAAVMEKIRTPDTAS
jgi:cell fate (sporulation/competence/biofilm development) regulator YlbF (YheA/YmcA/DUF963 family)